MNISSVNLVGLMTMSFEAYLHYLSCKYHYIELLVAAAAVAVDFVEQSSAFEAVEGRYCLLYLNYSVDLIA